MNKKIAPSKASRKARETELAWLQTLSPEARASIQKDRRYAGDLLAPEARRAQKQASDRKHGERRNRARIKVNEEGHVAFSLRTPWMPPTSTFDELLVKPDQHYFAMVERLQRHLASLAVPAVNTEYAATVPLADVTHITWLDWSQASSGSKALMAPHNGKVHRQNVELIRKMFILAFGADELPENVWKRRLNYAVLLALRTKHRDPRVAGWRQEDIERYGCAPGDDGESILTWLKKAAPIVPRALTKRLIDKTIAQSTLAGRGGGRSGKKQWEAALEDLFVQVANSEARKG